MCTRYYIETSHDLHSAIESVQSSSLTALMQEQLGKTVVINGEVRPTDLAAVIASNKNGARSVFPMIWGFTIPPSSRSFDSSFSKDPQNTCQKPQLLVNCRVETASRKPLWKDSWLHRRCVIPASYYYEWGKAAIDQSIPHVLTPADGRVPGTRIKSRNNKIKYAILPKDKNYLKRIMYLAGLYRFENHYPHFAILTRESSENIRFIHNRMPVILNRDSIDEWIHPQSAITVIQQIAREALTEMNYKAV